ncbi:MAG: 50S ribosomal protein L4, partial [Desulfobacterium sp.]|nr:50S ribosomal protein L4 [Desulfobacterium sp.]MBU4035341.1 50S ribosomal protein L4 [Pseudomonadota bacterium]
MPLIDVYNLNGEKVSQLELADSIFNIPVKPGVLHEVVTMQLACRRAGSASVKHRSDVRGSTRKLYRQKGTGRARRGDIKSPLLRGGGSIFGPDPRSYSYKVPKKIKRLALKMALSSKIMDNNILVIDKLEFEKAKTKSFISVLDTLKIKKALIVTEKTNENLELSS